MLTILYFLTLVVLAVATIILALRPRKAATAISSFVFVSLLAFGIIKQINAGEAAVLTYFGVPTGGILSPGLHFISPAMGTSTYITLRREFDVQGPVQASDANQLTVDVVLATRLHPRLLPEIQSKIGENYWSTLVQPAGRTAVREAFSQFPWVRALTNERGEMQQTIQRAFEDIIREQLKGAGFSDEDAGQAIIVLPAQLRSIIPDPKVSNAVAEKTASEQDLARQEILTEIAKQEAKRRENEGAGVRLMFQELPEHFSAAEISQVLSAVATKTRAEAMLKAVEGGQVKMVIMNGDGGSPVSVAATGIEEAQRSQAPR